MSNNIKISARAPGKLILLGEYAVLEGAPAIVAAINRAANVGIHPSADHHFRVEAPTLNFSPLLFSVDKSGKITLSEDVAAEIRQKLKFFKVTFETVGQELIKYNHTLSPVDILLDTSEFFLKHRQIKLGFGSSAALTIALLAALQGYYKKRVVTADNRWLFFKFAMQIHRTAQGNVGSGVDVAASAFGGILQYQLTNVEDESPASINRLALPENLYTLFIWTGKSASTNDLVSKVNAFKAAERKQYRKLIDYMDELSNSGCGALRDQDLPQYLEIVNAYHKAMQKLSELSNAQIITPEHQQLYQWANDCGAAYKPSGAGGGDFGIAFASSTNCIHELATIIQKSNFEIFNLNVVQQGVQIETTTNLTGGN